MLATSNMQHCLPALAAVFNFSSHDIDLNAQIDRIIASGEYGVSVVFKDLRKALARGEGELNPMEMETLKGLIGTGITLLEALLAMPAQQNVIFIKQQKLHTLLDEYKKLFEDIELFATDISAADCFNSAILGAAFSDLNTSEEDTIWRDL